MRINKESNYEHRIFDIQRNQSVFVHPNYRVEMRLPSLYLKHTHVHTCARAHTHTYAHYTRVYKKVSGLAAWRENCKWYSSLPLGAVVSLFYESV
jgi:hypothetical protein